MTAYAAIQNPTDCNKNALGNWLNAWRNLLTLTMLKMLGEMFYSRFMLYAICVTALVKRQAFPFPKVN